ncbi:hypothetical protein ABZ714_21775 [Streptomyces sp. NPDC006798]|uniref:hypothetical protein n=1 Tax=Streptomyces sp. NPDC006798 TaxID=3155462 RepID=UPI00341036B4
MALAGGVLAVGVLAAGPAGAAANRRPVDGLVFDACSPTVAHPAEAGAGCQGCVIADSTAAQAVLVVGDTSGGPVTISGAIDSPAAWPSSTASATPTLNTGFRRACLAPAKVVPCDGVERYPVVTPVVNGTSAGAIGAGVRRC